MVIVYEREMKKKSDEKVKEFLMINEQIERRKRLLSNEE